MLKPASAMPIPLLNSSLVGFCDSTYKNVIKFLLLVDVCFPVTLILVGDNFPNPDKRGSRYSRTCYDKAA